MRPVIKKVFLNELGHPTKKKYEPWGKAKPELVENLGSYCSYCEVPAPSKAAIDVEHIQDKNNPVNEHLVYDWDNFLLGCKNCNPVKSNKNVVLSNYHLPHLNNTMLSFRILEGGLIQINPVLAGDELLRAGNLLELVGLDRRPGHPKYSRKDDRWQNRMKAWDLATRYLKKHQVVPYETETLVDLAVGSGFFAVWMAVFQDYPEVKRALIAAFPGTATTCFDEEGNLINRNGTEI